MSKMQSPYYFLFKMLSMTNEERWLFDLASQEFHKAGGESVAITSARIEAKAKEKWTEKKFQRVKRGNSSQINVQRRQRAV